MKPLILISPWFGPWPEWINLFVESCKWNREIEWLIPTDQQPPENSAHNVRYQAWSFDDYRHRAASVLGADLQQLTPYKLCDLKPFLGIIHRDELQGYASFGYCDIDIIFGDLRSVYTDSMLSSHDAISAHLDRLSGHLAVLRNDRRMRNFATSIPRWRALLATPEHLGVDERHFTKLIRPRRRHLVRHLLAPRSLFVERFTTPGAIEPWSDGLGTPLDWVWRQGRLSHERGGAGTIYLHFMIWHSNRWRRAGTGDAPWPRLEKIVQCDWREAAEKGFSISPLGIRALP